MTSGEQRSDYEGWRVAGAAGVAVLVSFSSLFVYTFGVFLKPLAETFGWSREAVSASFGIAAMTVAVVSPGLGYLLDRVEPKRVIVPCVAVFGCAFASLSLLTPHIWHLYAVFVVLGLVGNGTAQMAYSRAVSSWFQQRLGLALALVMAGSGLGAVLLPPLAALLIARLGWRNAFLTLGIGALVIGLPTVIRFIRERPGSKTAGERGTEGASVTDGLQSRAFWIIVVVLFASSIAQNGAITHMAALLSDRGVPAGDAALAISAMGVASLAGRFATGWLLDRFFAARVAFSLMIVAAGGTFLLSGAHTLAVGATAAALIGFGMGGEADIVPYMLSRYFGLRAFSTLYGLTWTAYACAGAIGPVLMGRVFDLTGSYEALLVRLAIAMAGVGALMLLMPAYDARPSRIPGPATS